MNAMLRPDAAAAAFGVSKSTLARWSSRGLIAHAKVGGIVLYDAASIAELIAAHTTPRRVVPIAAQERATVEEEEEAFVTAFWKGTGAGR